MDKDIIEKLADLEHDSWSRWMKYLFSKGEFNENGTWTMPASLVLRWLRQMETPYEHLSEDEKEWDRKEVRKFLNVIEIEKEE